MLNDGIIFFLYCKFKGPSDAKFKLLWKGAWQSAAVGMFSWSFLSSLLYLWRNNCMKNFLYHLVALSAGHQPAIPATNAHRTSERRDCFSSHLWSVLCVAVLLHSFCTKARRTQGSPRKHYKPGEFHIIKPDNYERSESFIQMSRFYICAARPGPTRP